MHGRVIICLYIFLINFSSRNAKRKSMWKYETGAATTSRWKRRRQNVLSNVTYSPSHCQAGVPLISMQSTLRAAPDLCKNISLLVLFGSNGNSYTVCTVSDMSLYLHTFFTISRRRSEKRNKNRDTNECYVLKEIFPFIILVRQPWYR